ncbi:HlyD family efflux transporter periplasmic adaptor subunit [Desulfococcaceae bacterium HSG9]|nr:HlyD family efflux transporter periplasmic adaptor subunit [Desulfococcaceae bacterium HSG9]
MDDYSDKLKELKGKINVLSAIIRLGHEAFQKDSPDALFSHILNNSRHIAPYDRACLIDMRTARPNVIAVMGQSEVNANSEYCIQVRNLLRSFHALKQPLFVDDETLKRHNASKKTYNAHAYFKETFPGRIYLIPMQAPRSNEPDSNLFLWMLEFKDNSKEAAQGLLFLLAQHYSEALWSLLQRKSKITLTALKARRRITPLKMLGVILIVFVLALVFGRTHQNIAADFELVPENIFMQYAPFGGVLSESYFKNGDDITKDDAVIIYDIAKLQFELADARKKYDEISAELDLIRQESFRDAKQRGKIELLKIKQQKQQIDIDKIKWYLSQSPVMAEYSGRLVIEEQAKLMGRSVSAGEKLFEIIRPGKPFAKIWLNEADAVVLREQPLNSNWVTLYLHTLPETAINGTIVSISPKPVLSETGQFSYIIRMALNVTNPELTSNFIDGMRGVARVKGREVSLGYYLFRNLILAWRKI